MELLCGFPPFPAPVSLETAISCPPVAFFGARCAVSLEAAFFLAGFHAPTINLAHSSLRLWLHFGICCSSGIWLYLQSSDIETMEGVPTTNSQSETSRRKQCKSVSKKSGGLNLRLYHLERNVHPGMRLRLALGLVRVQYQSA